MTFDAVGPFYLLHDSALSFSRRLPMKKNALTLIISALLLMSLASCGSNVEQPEVIDTPEETVTEVVEEVPSEDEVSAPAEEEPEEEIPAGHIRPDDYDPDAAIGEPGWYPTAQGLVDYCLYWKDQPHCYSWDANGQYLTKEFIDQYSAWYPDWFGVDDRLELRREIQDQGVRAFDCIGIIKAYVWGDYSQDNTSRRTDDTNYYTRDLLHHDTVYGPLRELPEVPGIVLWRKGHVGIYLGDGKVIECTQEYYPKSGESKVGGIIISDLKDRGWAYWVEYPGILYLDEDDQ